MELTTMACFSPVEEQFAIYFCRQGPLGKEYLACEQINKALHVLKHKVMITFEDRCGSLSILTSNNYKFLFYPETHSPDKKVEKFTLSQMNWLLLTKPTTTQKSK